MSDNPMTNRPDIDALEAALKKTTQGEWKTGTDHDGYLYCAMDGAHQIGWDLENACSECFGNMEFIAAAHNAMPDLLAHVRALEAENKRLSDLAWRYEESSK